MTERYDIVIVGAGPAGSFLAKELARLCPNAKTLLIDGQSEERKKPCGGLLAPDAQKFFAQLNMTLPNSILADPQIFTVETIDLVTRQVRYYQRHYLNMDRYRFDRWLLSLVPDEIEIIAGRVTEITKNGDCYLLSLGHQTVITRFLVGADGGGSLVRRFFGKKQPKQYISIQEWYKSDSPTLPYYSCIFDPETGDSCSWTICKDGYIVYGGAFEKQGCRETFAKQKARLEDFLGVSLGKAEKREACLITSPRHFRDLFCGEDGVFLIGEAAGLISASSFEGISSALISAKKLAESFQSGNNDAKKILRTYQKHIFSLRIKLWSKMAKRGLLCSPRLRYCIMKSGVCSIQKEKI